MTRSVLRVPDDGGQSVGGAPRVESHRATVDGVELHWTERGSGTPLVILHGLADSQHTWEPVATALGRRHRVLCLDLPGCGLSGRPDASYSLDWQARLAASWLDQIGVSTCDVLGHSYGGGVALWLLLYRARAIRKLVLVAPGGLGVEVGVWLRLAGVLGTVEHGSELLLGVMTRLITRLHGCSLSACDRRSLWQLNSRVGTGRAYARTVRDVIDWRGQTRHFSHRAADIETLPAIALFWGERDRVIPIRHGEALCDLLDNCSLWRLPDAGHFLHWQAPEALARAVLAYLDAPEAKPSRLKTKAKSALP